MPSLYEFMDGETAKLLISVLTAVAGAFTAAFAAYTMKKFVQVRSDEEKIIIEFKNGQRLEVAKRADELDAVLQTKIKELEAEVERLKKAAENRS